MWDIFVLMLHKGLEWIHFKYSQYNNSTTINIIIWNSKVFVWWCIFAYSVIWPKNIFVVNKKKCLLFLKQFLIFSQSKCKIHLYIYALLVKNTSKRFILYFLLINLLANSKISLVIWRNIAGISVMRRIYFNLHSTAIFVLAKEAAKQPSEN